MKTKRLILSLLVISLLFIFLTGRAMASYAITEATLQWFNINITGDIEWIEKWTSTDADVSYNFTSNSTWHDSDDWISLLYSNVSIYQAEATGYADPNYLRAYTEVGPDGVVEPEAESYARRGGIFKFNGVSGDVVIKIPFSLEYEIEASSIPEASALGMVEVCGILGNNNAPGGDVNTFWKLAANMVTDGNKIEYYYDGTLELTKNFSFGDIGYFEAWIDTNSNAYTVPAPAPIILLGSGFLGLIGLSKFRKKG